MRLFVAVVPPPLALDDLDDFLSVRREAREAAGFRWTSPDAWHLTLAFCERVAERNYDEFIERLGTAAAKRTPFETAITGGGAFPDVSRGKVLWAGLSVEDGAREELDHLVTGSRNAAATSGIEVDGTRFRPHLTLARFGRPLELTRWVRLLEAYHGPYWTADEITLVESHLGEGPHHRPRYEIRETFALGQPATP